MVYGCMYGHMGVLYGRMYDVNSPKMLPKPAGNIVLKWGVKWALKVVEKGS